MLQVNYICPFDNPSAIRGTLTITNYRLYFRPQQKEKPVIIDVPLGFVSRVEKVHSFLQMKSFSTIHPRSEEREPPGTTMGWTSSAGT